MMLKRASSTWPRGTNCEDEQHGVSCETLRQRARLCSVELGMGSKTSRVPDHSRGMFNRGPRAEALQGSGAPSELDGAPMGRPKIEADLGGKGTFQAHNPLNHPAARGESDSDSKSMRSTLICRDEGARESARDSLRVATAVRHPAFSARQDTTAVGAGTAAGAAMQGDLAVGNPCEQCHATLTAK